MEKEFIRETYRKKLTYTNNYGTRVLPLFFFLTVYKKLKLIFLLTFWFINIIAISGRMSNARKNSSISLILVSEGERKINIFLRIITQILMSGGGRKVNIFLRIIRY